VFLQKIVEMLSYRVGVVGVSFKSDRCS